MDPHKQKIKGGTPMKTKALALVLALCMVFAMLPATAFAARPMQALTPATWPCWMTTA